MVRGPIGNTPPAFANAMVDGRVVVEDFIDTYKKGAQHQVPLMIGANSAEFGTGAVPEPDAVFRSLGDAKDKALAMYDGYGSRDPKLIGMEITSDMGMNNGTRYVARLIAKAGKPVFFYHFGYVTESGRATSPAARHASELVYVFDTLGSRTTRGGAPIAISDADRKIAKQMNGYWARFAKTGDPNGAGAPRWPALHSSERRGPRVHDERGTGRTRALQGVQDGILGRVVRFGFPGAVICSGLGARGSGLGAGD